MQVYLSVTIKKNAQGRRAFDYRILISCRDIRQILVAVDFHWALLD